MSGLPLYQMTGNDLTAAAHADRQGTHLLALAGFVRRGLRGFYANEQHALQLVKQAAALGHARAMRLVGDHENEQGNEEQAVTWWRRAAQAGDADAMSNLHGALGDSPEAQHWLQQAARAGQPYAVNMCSPNPPRQMSIVEFGMMSLEEMAAGHVPTGTELSFEVEEVKGNLPQVNNLVGMWLERLRPYLPDLYTVAEVDSEAADFPCPDPRTLPPGITTDNNTIEVMVHSGLTHLQLSANLWDEGWTISLTSFDPHPTREQQQWLVGQLLETMQMVGLKVPRGVG